MKANSNFTSRFWIRWAGLSLIIVLLLAACAPAATPTPASANPITGIVWQWTSVTEAGQTTTVPDPENYTIIFNTDGTVTGKADCNTFSGTYSQQNGFTIKVTPAVMSACGTLDSQYLTLLNHVAAGGLDGAGGLALETAGAAQRMMFKNGGPAPASVTPAAPIPTTAPASSNPIQGIVWQWTSVTNQSTKQTTTMPTPENYTIIFNADGTLTGEADCNTFNGVYSQANGFTIKLGASTMAFCGEASLDQQYLKLLSNVAAGGPDGAGGLALETAGGEQRMMFKNGGAAP